MKKFLLVASALAGFTTMAQAQEATTVKTTTVQYQVPTCTNCRTTTQVKTTYPEPEPVCTTCEPVVAQPVMMKRKEKKKILCRDNHELGIRNPLFVVKEGQLSIQQVDGVFKEPKRTHKRPNPATGERHTLIENRGYQAYGQVVYGITDRWSVKAFGGKKYSIPKTSQYRAMMEEAFGDDHYAAIPHTSGYDANLGTYYHVLDLCHLDVILGIEGTWHREKTKRGDEVKRVNGWGWRPTVTIGSNWGWFTPYVTASYVFDHTKVIKNAVTGKKGWEDDHKYIVNPGIYIQPSKWYAFDFSVNKPEDQTAQWNAGVDFYPYKNIALGAQFNARRPFRDPMHMYGVSGVAKVVF
ncbi:MAG: hypothetical protein II938_01740 [Alphaproteobacteria bacterium]|nr:hypothetical protein [Alphaproteobacteria bacterium]